MDYYCKLCDETIKRISKNKYFKSENHISSENSFIGRYIILNPDFDKVDEIMRKFVNSYTEKYNHYVVRCLKKILTNTNSIKQIRITTKTNLHYTQYIPKN